MIERSAQLETDRLILRQLQESDLNDLYLSMSDPITMASLGRGPMTANEVWREIAYHLGHWQLRGFGMWAVVSRDSGQVIGRVGPYQPAGWPGIELGWLIGRPYWGQGYASEAGQACLDYVHTELQVDAPISLISPNNIASARVAQKLGGRIDRQQVINATLANVWVYPN